MNINQLGNKNGNQSVIIFYVCMNVGMNLCILWNNPTEDFSLAMYSVFEALEAFIPKPRKLSLTTKMSSSLSRCSASALAAPQTRCRQTWN